MRRERSCPAVSINVAPSSQYAPVIVDDMGNDTARMKVGGEAVVRTPSSHHTRCSSLIWIMTHAPSPCVSGARSRGRHVVTRLSRAISSWVISGDNSLTKPRNISHSTKHMMHDMCVYLVPIILIQITLFLRRMHRHARSRPSFQLSRVP